MVTLWRRFRRWRMRDRIAFRAETERAWRAQQARLAEQWRRHIEHLYADNPTAARMIFQHDTVAEALADPDGEYQWHLKESQRSWEPIA